MSKSRLFSGKIKKLHGDKLSVERYNYLDSSQAEPDLGSPSLDGALLVGSTSSNVRTWSQILTVDTATFTILSTLSNRFSDQPQALDIKGGAVVRGNLHVNGTAYLNDAEILTTQSGLTSVLGNSIINQSLLVNTSTNSVSTDTGALRVLGGVGIGLDLYVGGAGYINNAQIVTTATIDNFASKTTIVAGTDTAINTSTGIVTVWNTSTLQSVTDRGAVTTNAISITNTTLSTSSTTGALVVSGGVGVLQDVYIGQNLYVAGTAYLNDAEVLTTSSGLSSTLGQTEVSQNLFVNTTTNSTSTTTGAIVTPGGVGIGKNLYVGENLYVDGTAYLNNAEVLTTASRITSLEGLTQVTQDFLINTTTNTLSLETGALQVRGGAAFVKDVRIGQSLYVNGSVFLGDAQVLTTSSGVSSVLGRTVISQELFVNTTTNSVSTETGAIVTPGGVGIGQDVFIGGKLKLQSTLNSTSTLANNALYVSGGAAIGQSLIVEGPAYFRNTVVFSGTTTNIASSNTFYTDNLINIHVPQGSFTGTDHSWILDDGKDQGFVFHYYKDQDRDAFLGFSNDTGYLEWYDNGTEVGSVFTGTSYGTFKTGAIVLTSTTASGSTTTGALIVAGGVGVGGSINVASTSYIRGSKILTAADLETITYTAEYITNDPTLVAVSGTTSTYGTYNFGDLEDILTFNDYNTGTSTGFYSINDATGAPGYLVYVGFANITTFNRIVLNINYTQNSGHTVGVELYNYETSGWDTFTTYSGLPGWYQLALGVIDEAPYISSGDVTLRLNHSSSGNTSHRTWIDYVALEYSLQGGQGPRGPAGTTGATGAQGLTTSTTSTFIFLNTTSATSTVSAALVVAGGVGIGKNIHVAGDINFSGSLYNNGILFTGGGGGGFTSSDVPPEDPVEGERWYDTTLGLEFVWVLDDNSGQWVEISTAGNGEKGADGNQGYGSVNFYTRNYVGDSTTTNFVISADLTVDNVFVFENGVMQFPTTDYSVIGTTLSFVTPPASGVAVQIREINNAGSNIIPLTVKAQGTTTTSTVSVIDFVGNVVATNDGSVVTVTIEAGSPKMSSIIVTDSSYNNLDDTAVALEGGYIKIIGSGFASGCSVLIGNVPATSTTFISSTEVRAQVPATSAGTYIVYLVNTDGGTAIRVNGITFSSTPTWVTSSGLSGTSGSPVSYQLSATGATTFALQAGSTLPSGLTLTSGGLLSGTVTIESDTVYSVTILATDTELQDSPRTFSITITAGDLLFMYNSLLLAGNGTNNANNNTFLDSSTNNFTVTRGGNTAQGTFTPYGPNWSAYIPSAGQTYLTAGSNTALALGSGDFTVECWLYLNSLAPSYTTLLDWRTNGAAGSGIPVITDFNNNGTLAFVVGNGSGFTSVVNSSSTMPINSWFHLAVVRSGSTVTMYFNGTSVGTGTSSANCGIETFNIGNPQAANYTAPMYVSNVRLVKGTAVYTSAFTPSTAPLTAVANTQLLTLQSPYLKDNSSNAFAVSKVSTISIQRFSPFNPVAAYSTNTIGGSAYFDGTGDYLSTPYSTLTTQWWTQNFTIEMWVFNNTNAVSVTNQLPLQFAHGVYSSDSTYWALGTNASGQVQFYYYNGSANSIVSTAAAPLKAWNHIAMVYTHSSGNISLYLNGTSVASATKSGTPLNSVNDTLNVGVAQGTYYNGYISNIRILNGTALYSSTFTPSTTPLTAITNTNVLYNFTNAGIIDNSMMNNLETVGDAKISTVQSKFGGSSMYFDGTGDYLFLPTLNAINLSKFLTAKFTVECWAYLTNSSSDRTIISAINSWGAGANYNIEVRSGGLMHIQLGNSITMTNGSVSFPLNQWNHIALVRTGATSTVFYLNGVAVATDTNNWTADEDCPLTVGCFSINGGSLANYWSGYIDDLRITKGVARYTTNFTPSTYPIKLS